MTRKAKSLLFLLATVLLATGATLASKTIQDKKKIRKTLEIRDKLQHLSLDERECLGRFFDHAIFETQFGYVLFGNKPLSFDNILKKEFIQSYYFRSYWNLWTTLDMHDHRRALEIWKKYKHLFPLKNFILAEQADQFPEMSTVFLVHKKHFLKTVEKHRKDFESVLGKKFDPKQILDSFKNKRALFFRQIKYHDGLFGTLLGYGRNNAWIYHESRDLLRDLEGDAFVEKRQALYPQLEGSTSCEDYYPDFGLPVSIPGFICDPTTKETKDLLRDYKKQRRKISKVCIKGNLLETVLTKLTE